MTLPKLISSRLPASKNAGKEKGTVVILLLSLAFLFASIFTSYLITTGRWYIAGAIICVIAVVIILHRYPFSAVIIWLLAMPFLLQTNTSIERQLYWIIHRALPPLTLMIMLLTYFLKINSRVSLSLGWQEIGMAGYLLISVYSIIAENNDILATTYLLYDRVFSPMCLYLIVRFWGLRLKEIRWLVYIALFTTVFQSIIGVISWVDPHILPSDWLGFVGSRTVGSLNNTNIFTTTLVFYSLWGLQAALNSNAGFKRNLFIGAFLLAAYSIFISYSRASWLAGILIVLGLIFLYPKFMIRLSLFLSPLLIIFSSLLLTNQLAWAQQRLSSFQSERSALTRLPVDYAGYKMFLAKPVLGWGYGNFDRYSWQFFGSGTDLPYSNLDHASHNLYITIIAEQGLVGLILYLFPMICLLIPSVKIYPKLPKTGFLSGKLLIILWLSPLTHIIVNNFANMRVVYGLGMWWFILALIANFIQVNRTRFQEQELALQNSVVSNSVATNFSIN